jgi:flagellar biosynthesis protein FlhF
MPCALAATCAAPARQRGRALALVDTPGVSARDGRGLAALAGLLGPCGASEIHLVLPATSKAADALVAVRAFAPLGVTHLLLSRMDETVSPGSLLSVSIEGGLPLSYFGVGREVPNDVQPATARELARRILHGGPEG